jgi:hypothetical protein
MSDELTVVNRPVGALIGPVMDVGMAKDRIVQLQQFVQEYLVKDEDFGTIPGTPKPTLLKPGADKLCELYGLSDDYEVTQRTEDFDKGLFDYEVKCILISKAGGFLVSTGLGSCNSYEKKYRWRDAQRLCPNCGKNVIIKGKEEYGGGWLCFSKKGGCGAKFADNDTAITGQTVGRVQNEDVADIKNTILKMAKKRAKVDATLSATRSSGLFTQDMEDWDIPKYVAPQVQDSHQNTPSGAPATTPSDQPAKQYTASQTQDIQGPTKRIPATPPDELDGLIATVASIKEWPKTEKFNATMNVKFATPLEGSNQGVSWKVDFAVCWHTHLMESLRNTVGKECHFLIKENDRKKNVTDEWPTHYINIEDLVSITDPETGEYQEYVNGKPVLQQ